LSEFGQNTGTWIAHRLEEEEEKKEEKVGVTKELELEKPTS